MTRTTVAILAALLATPTLAMAQQSRDGVAQLRSVKGNVLISREAGLAAGGEAARLVEHTRVITTANSEGIVVFDNGCEVRLKENQRFEVESDKPCAALIAQVQSILVPPPAVALAAGPAGSGFWNAVPIIGGVLIGVEILRPSPSPPPPAPLSPS